MSTDERSEDNDRPDPLDPPAGLARSAATRLSSGYGVRTEERAGGDLLEIVAPDGRVCLQIVLTPEGPRVQIESAALHVRTHGALQLECEALAVHARESISLRSDGGVSIEAGVDLVANAGRMIETEAWGQEIRARRGDVHLEANDDVLLDGERVRLNSPRTPKELAALARVRGLPPPSKVGP